MADIDPRLLQMLAKALGPRLTPQHIEGFLMGQGLQNVSQSIKSAQPKAAAVQQPGQPVPPGQQPTQPRQPPRPAQPQQAGQAYINKAIPGPGPLRSNTTPDQLMALASLLADHKIAQQLATMGLAPPRGPSPQPGIPGVPGPKITY